MKRLGVVLVLVVFALVGSGVLIGAAPNKDRDRDDKDKRGVSHQLADILAELQIIASLIGSGGSGGSCGCDDRVHSPAQAEGLVVSPALGDHVLVSIVGPGKFVSARMVKQGGLSGLTAISLEIDGNIVENRNVAALKNWGMTQSNPFGVVVQSPSAGIDTVTIGFPEALVFESNLTLKAVVNEMGVDQIIGTVIYGH
jgi:hypothetical protein